MGISGQAGSLTLSAARGCFQGRFPAEFLRTVEALSQQVPAVFGRQRRHRSAAAEANLTFNGRVNDWPLHLLSVVAAMVTETS
jgi:hypothetical protein